jgi:H/ACA ribonucleoprotein complex non-core subunit NAF1
LEKNHIISLSTQQADFCILLVSSYSCNYLFISIGYMSTSGIDELTNEAPPAKRARTESNTSANLTSTSPLSASINTSENILSNGNSGEISDQQITGKDSSAMSQSFSGIPGLGRIGHAPVTPLKVEESAAKIPAVKDEATIEEPHHEQLSTENGNQEDSKMANAEPSQENTELTNSAATTKPDFQMQDEASKLVQRALPPADAVSEIPQGSNTNDKVEGENLHTKMEVEVEVAQVPVNATTNTEKAAESLPVDHMEHISPTGMAGVETEMVEAKQASTNSTADTENNPQTHMDDVQTEAVDESSPPELTHALEALLGGLSEPATSTATATATETETTLQPTGEEHPEWEIDSSPYESSSDDSSSDDSSSEDSDEEDGENSYKLLSPEEQARILMEGDGGSDDEGTTKGAKGTGAQVRTKNEIPEEVIPKPDVTITPEMPIQELGNVETMVEGVVLIKAKTSGEYRVLREESVLCLEDRSVIGVVSDTLGRVEQPLYCVRFTNADAIAEAGLSLGTKIFYSEQHSTYVFTQALKAYKGSDASNLHDEEVGDEEMEFSDDEAEMEHKRKIKQKRMEKRGGKMQQNGGSGHSGHPLQQSSTPADSAAGLSYDEAEDGPYKPLARPAGFTGGAGEAPQEGSHHNRQIHRGDHGGRGRGRGRGDRGRGDRGRGRGGGHNDRSKGYSLPAQMQTNNGFAPPNPSPGGFFNAQPPLLQGYSPSPQPYPPNNLYNNANTPQYSPQQPQIWPPYPQNFQQGYQQPFTNPPNAWPGMPPPPPLPSGAFINPAFFNQMTAPNQWNQPGSQNGNDRSKP